MKIVKIILVLIVFLLSVAAGVAKLMQMPQEVQFFESAGLGNIWMLILGAIQVLGALLLLIKKYRHFGAALAALGFLASAVIIFMTGQSGFAVISLLPVLVAIYVFMFARKDGA